MATRFSEDNFDYGLLNREFQRTQDLHDLVKRLTDQLSVLQQQQNVFNDGREAKFYNNIHFTWDGPTAKISWADGYIKDVVGNTYRISANHQTGFTANTYYWIGWNTSHRQMVIQSDLSNILNNTNNLLICSVYTGTLIQAGDLGGGYTEGGHTGYGVGKYKLF